MAELVFFRRSDELMRVSLDGRLTTVGRGPANDILLPDPGISRQQFSIERQGSAWVLKDLSGRGTELAGQRVTEAQLADGSDIGLAQWRAVFYLAASTGYAGDTTLHLGGSGNTAIQPRYGDEGRFTAVRLHIHSGDEEERSVPFPGEALVGSGEKCTVRVNDPFVSARHARIEARPSGFAVTDLQSKNGTYVGRIRVYEVEIPLGCPIVMGNTELVLRLPERNLGVATFEGMVGSDPAMRRVYETVERVAPSNAAVAIFGESGTGKELVARALHGRSSRSREAFVPVNCGALSKELVESELFGYEKGAFTGADRVHKGAFEESNGGTLFLDEIGELPLAAQAKLLRALELGEIKRVGASRPINVDVRVVAATNRDLRAEIKRGAFREDLYWRLCVVPVQLPPLRARKGDLRMLIKYFLKMYTPPTVRVSLTDDGERRMLDYDWPGNVRELKNTIHRSLLLRKGTHIEAQDITFDRERDAAMVAENTGVYDPHLDDLERVFIIGKNIEAVDEEVFVKACRRLGTRASKVAAALGLSRGAVYRRMERLGIAPAPPEE